MKSEKIKSKKEAEAAIEKGTKMKKAMQMKT